MDSDISYGERTNQRKESIWALFLRCKDSLNKKTTTWSFQESGAVPNDGGTAERRNDGIRDSTVRVCRVSLCVSENEKCDGERLR